MKKITVFYGLGLFLAGAIGNEFYRRSVVKHELQFVTKINKQLDGMNNKNTAHNEGVNPII